MPLISVVLPVFNAQQFLGEAIKSILNQSYKDFELLIIDDCSTDKTLNIAESFRDNRIRIFENAVNIGRAGSDNKGHQLANGKYIAKMDSDDICNPKRLEKQKSFLDNHPDINTVGSWMQNFGASKYLNKYPDTPAKAKCFTLFGLPVGNPSVMMRASLFNDKGCYYDANLRQTEDYDFFARYIHDLSVVTLNESLIFYRNFPQNYKPVILSQRAAVSNAVRQNLLTRWGISFTSRELLIHNAIAFSDTKHSEISLPECADWLGKLHSYNSICTWFQQDVLEEFLAEKWFHTCYFHSQNNFSNWRIYQAHELKRSFQTRPTEMLKFFIKSILNK